MFWESRSILPVLRNNDRMWTFLAFSDIQHATKLTVLTVLLPVRLHLSSFYTCEFVIYVQALKQPFDILPLATRIDSLGLYAMTAVQVRAHAHSAAFVSQTELLKWQCAVIPCSPALCRTWHCVVESDPKFQNDTSSMSSMSSMSSQWSNWVIPHPEQNHPHSSHAHRCQASDGDFVVVCTCLYCMQWDASVLANVFAPSQEVKKVALRSENRFWSADQSAEKSQLRWY